jgi:CRISPR/Cas system-associated exonuclease Cas4 (RecB family)
METELKEITPEHLLNQIENHYQSKIKNYKQSHNRASNLGACQRALVYKRTQPENESLHDSGLQRIFDEGNYQEKAVIQLFMNLGYDVTKNQREIDHHPDFKAANITGHTDLEISMDGFESVLIEAKSMSPNIFPYVNEIKDLDSYFWTRKYYTQIQLYMHGTGFKKCFLYIKCKSTAKEKILQIDYDPDHVKKIIKKAKEIERHIKKKTLPGRTTHTDECEKCNFKHICCPDMHFTGVELLQEYDDIQDTLEEMESLKEYTKKYDKLNDRKKFFCKQLKPDVEKVFMPKFELYKSGRGWKFRRLEDANKNK